MKLVVLALCVAVAVATDGEPEEATATVTQVALDKAAMQSSSFVNQYCSAANKKMSGEGYRSQFAPDLDQCLNRCNRDPDCSSADFSADKTCNQHKAGGEAGEEGGWTHYHRRAKNEENCPEGFAPHVMAPSPYGGTFCVYADTKCPGHDLYRKSQNIANRDKCMDKCAKIKSCASADFKDGKCAPKDHACTPAELVRERGITFMQRLEAGVQGCECAGGFTRDAEGVCQPDGPCSGSIPQDISGVPVVERNGKILIQRNAPCGTPGRITFDKNWANFKNGFGDTANTNIGYWAGLEFLHAITTNSAGDSYRLVVELPHSNGNTYWAYYDNFVVACEADGYRMTVGAYSGNGGDAFNRPTIYNRGTENGSPFSTFDNDNDDWSSNCASSFGAGWWFSSCFSSYPNGPCPGEAKYKPEWAVTQSWYNVAWSRTQGYLAGTYMMLEKM